MKVGITTRTNPKGQIVIPKKVRDALGIGTNALLNIVVRGRGMYVYPVEEIIHRKEKESSYLKLLEKTKGAWSEDWDQLRKKRRVIELTASRKRKQAW